VLDSRAMNNFVREFRDFINKGDVVTIAVGLIMALYFTKIVDALLNGVINPIIAAIFSQPNFTEIGFDIGDARISIGLVLDAVISFIVVAFILFLIIKAYNRYKGPAETKETEVNLLAEIRDELRAQRPS
jgi:large conductance mechanosensitive channel